MKYLTKFEHDCKKWRALKIIINLTPFSAEHDIKICHVGGKKVELELQLDIHSLNHPTVLHEANYISWEKVIVIKITFN